MTSRYESDEATKALVDDVILATYRGVLEWGTAAQNKWSTTLTDMVIKVFEEGACNSYLMISKKGGESYTIQISYGDFQEIIGVIKGGPLVLEVARALEALSGSSSVLSLLGGEAPGEVL